MRNVGRQDTRGRLVEAARQLFWTRGYEATSLSDVVQRAKVNPGSLYYFFKTKEELLLAVLERYLGLLEPAVIEPAFRRQRDPIERIFAVLDGYRQGLVETGFRQGCPIGNLALEVGDGLPRARKKIAANFRAWRGWIRRCLEDAGGRLPPDLDRDGLAAFVLTVMEGAVMQARVHGSLAPFDASVAQLRDYFRRFLSTAKKQARRKK